MALALLAGCGQGGRRPARDAGSALWIGAGAPPLVASDTARLESAGVNELFVHAADLEVGAGELEVVRLPIPDLPPATEVTLVVAGELPAGAGKAVAEPLAEALQQLRFAAEGAGLVPVGCHLDVLERADLEAYGELLAGLRGRLDRSLRLSISVPRDWLRDPTLAAVVAEVDFFVPFLYGQRVHEAEAADAWDFRRVEAHLEQVEALGRDYLLGLVTLGTATRLSSEGRVRARTTRMELREPLWDRNLSLQVGFSLEGVNRRVYTLTAEHPTTVGRWEVRPKESIRIVRPATSDLEELHRLVGAWSLPHHLGQVYYRLASPEERLSLTLDNLLNALDPAPATPELELAAAVQRRTGRGFRMRFGIENHNGEITSVSLIDHNYLEVQVHNGTFDIRRIEVGDFYRYDLLKTGGGEARRTFRDADVLRLHVAVLGGEEEVRSGDVEIRSRGVPDLSVSAVFLLTDGRTLRVGPQRWRGGDPVVDGEG